ncbi:MAG: hypothetical protein M3Z84_06220, partial [Actinomycetota bacterium]|nr:hypothetical protein [Actinomycetota bacterium]
MKPAEMPVADRPGAPGSPAPARDPVRRRRLEGLFARARPWAAENSSTLLGVAVGVAIALWLTAGVWGSRLPAGNDVTGHLVRAQAGTALLR